MGADQELEELELNEGQYAKDLDLAGDKLPYDRNEPQKK
jgi:hypothetical protein